MSLAHLPVGGSGTWPQELLKNRRTEIDSGGIYMYLQPQNILEFVLFATAHNLVVRGGGR